MEAQRKLVTNLEATVAALTAEVVELRKAVSDQTTGVSNNGSTESWSTVVRRGGRQTAAKSANSNGHRGRANPSNPRRATANPTSNGRSSECVQSHSSQSNTGTEYLITKTKPKTLKITPAEC